MTANRQPSTANLIWFIGKCHLYAFCALLCTFAATTEIAQKLWKCIDENFPQIDFNTKVSQRSKRRHGDVGYAMLVGRLQER